MKDAEQAGMMEDMGVTPTWVAEDKDDKLQRKCKVLSKEQKERPTHTRGTIVSYLGGTGVLFGTLPRHLPRSSVGLLLCHVAFFVLGSYIVPMGSVFGRECFPVSSTLSVRSNSNVKH